MNSAGIMISTEEMIDTASMKSSSTAGIGRIRMTMISMMPTARPISPRNSVERRSEPVGTLSPKGILDRAVSGAEVMSLKSIVPEMPVATHTAPPGRICQAYG